MKVVITGDWHLEAGQHLGDLDADLGNTRMADAKRVLEQIAQEKCDVLVFLGDALAQSPSSFWRERGVSVPCQVVAFRPWIW